MYEQIEVTVLLRRGSKPQSFPSVEQEAARLPRGRKYLTREESAALHGASAADVKKLRAFARRHKLQTLSQDTASRIVKLRGIVQAFNTAFGAELRRYEHESGTYRCRIGPITIPVDLDGIIEGVFELDNRPQAKPHFRLRKQRPNFHAHAVLVS